MTDCRKPRGKTRQDPGGLEAHRGAMQRGRPRWSGPCPPRPCWSGRCTEPFARQPIRQLARRALASGCVDGPASRTWTRRSARADCPARHDEAQLSQAVRQMCDWACGALTRWVTLVDTDKRRTFSLLPYMRKPSFVASGQSALSGWRLPGAATPSPQPARNARSACRLRSACKFGQSTRCAAQLRPALTESLAESAAARLQQPARSVLSVRNPTATIVAAAPTAAALGTTATMAALAMHRPGEVLRRGSAPQADYPPLPGQRAERVVHRAPGSFCSGHPDRPAGAMAGLGASAAAGRSTIRSPAHSR